jgi:hypothetical protein
MNELAHLLNISYNIAEEFKVVYKRIEWIIKDNRVFS